MATDLDRVADRAPGDYPSEVFGPVVLGALAEDLAGGEAALEGVDGGLAADAADGVADGAGSGGHLSPLSSFRSRMAIRTADL